MITVRRLGKYGTAPYNTKSFYDDDFMIINYVILAILSKLIHTNVSHDISVRENKTKQRIGKYESVEHELESKCCHPLCKHRVLD